MWRTNVLQCQSQVRWMSNASLPMEKYLGTYLIKGGAETTEEMGKKREEKSQRARTQSFESKEVEQGGRKWMGR